MFVFMNFAYFALGAAFIHTADGVTFEDIWASADAVQARTARTPLFFFSSCLGLLCGAYSFKMPQVHPGSLYRCGKSD